MTGYAAKKSKAKAATCGDGTVAKTEKCDDGNTNGGDGCSSSCKIESGYSCSGKPSSCTTTCGDGVQAGSEGCDNGGSNTDTACTASYGGSCTYCTTSCSSVTVQGASCRDGTCDSGSETCSSCLSDCGECNIQENEPTASFILPYSQIANLATISTLTLTEGNQCWLSIDQTDVAEASTKRGRSTGRTTIFTNKPISCISATAESEVKSEIQNLANGVYSIMITLENNKGVISVTKPLKIFGAATTLTGLDPEITYTNLNPPKVSSTGADGTSCSWKLNGGSSTTYTCLSGLSDLDLSTYSQEGINTFELTIDSSGYSKEYTYYSSAAVLEEVISRSFGSGGDSGDIDFVIGDHESFIDPAVGKATILAMLYDLGKSYATTVDKRNELLDIIKNKEAIGNELSAIASAASLSTIKFAAMRSVDLDAKKLKVKYTTNLATYESKKEGNSWSSSQKEKSTEFSFTKSGEKTVRIVIKT